MEFLLQYLDDLDDFLGMLALIAERIRRAFRALILMSITAAIHLAGFMLAIAKPPLALAVVSLVSVGMLYRAVVTHSSKTIPAR